MVTIMDLEEGKLAKQVLMEQVAQGYPGLDTEARVICEELGIPDICDGMKEMKSNSMVKCDQTKPPPYFSSKCLAQARMGFRVQTRMVVCPGNMKGKFWGRVECGLEEGGGGGGCHPDPLPGLPRLHKAHSGQGHRG